MNSCLHFQAWQTVAVAIFSLASVSNSCQGQNRSNEELDRVFYGPVKTGKADENKLWTRETTAVLTGKIRRFDAQELVILDAQGKSNRLASDRVFKVDVSWKPSAASALELLESRKYREAIPALQSALQEGFPPWQSQFLVNGLVRAAAALDRPRVAGIVFLQYQASETPPDLFFADLPLAWTPKEPDRLLREQAAKWLVGSSEAEQLLGASWSLSGSSREVARQTLLRLEASSSKVIASLAVCQGWRFSAPPATMQQLDTWLAFRDSLIRPLQLGPTEFIADRLMRIGQKDLAIGQWMRIATIHSQRYDRVKIALNAARSTLQRDGNTAEAERIAEWIKDLEE